MLIPRGHRRSTSTRSPSDFAGASYARFNSIFIGYDVNSGAQKLHTAAVNFVLMKMNVIRRISIAFAAVLLLIGLAACEVERRKSDAELGLDEQQARGRHVYDQQCIRCHEPYSRWGTKGPTLKGIYKKQYMPSGLPVNDDRMHDVIWMGKAKMPAFNQTLTERQVEDLLAYLKTL